jgi:hypothetical protein
MVDALNTSTRNKPFPQWPTPHWGVPGKPNNRHERRRINHQIRQGRRVAAVRAFTGATLYLNGFVPTLAAAAEACGSNVPYVRDAIAILQSKDGERLKARVLKDHVSLLAAARQVKPVADALRLYNKMNPEMRRAFFSAAGSDRVLDDLVAAG